MRAVRRGAGTPAGRAELTHQGRSLTLAYTTEPSICVHTHAAAAKISHCYHGPGSGGAHRYIVTVVVSALVILGSRHRHIPRDPVLVSKGDHLNGAHKVFGWVIVASWPLVGHPAVGVGRCLLL